MGWKKFIRSAKHTINKAKNQIEHAVGKVEKEMKGAEHAISDAAKATFKEAKPIVGDIVASGRSIIQTPTVMNKTAQQMMSGFGNAANFIPYMLAGLAALIVLNARNIGGAIGAARGGF